MTHKETAAECDFASNRDGTVKENSFKLPMCATHKRPMLECEREFGNDVAPAEPSRSDTVEPRVLNRGKLSPGDAAALAPDSVFVGRPSKWGNPYKIGRDGTRKEVIERYREYLLSRPDMIVQCSELRGKNLICFCAPLACHADILLVLANALEPVKP